jgi:hypothetical protein
MLHNEIEAMDSGNQDPESEGGKRAEHSSTNADCENMNLAVRSVSTAIAMHSIETIRPQKRLRTSTGGLIARRISRSSTPNKKRFLSEKGSLGLP